MKRRIFSSIVSLGLAIVAWGLAPSDAVANETRSGYMRVGNIDVVNLRNDSITIDDSEYIIPSGVRVHAPGKEHESRSTLRPGLHVRFSSVQQSGRWVISEVWILGRAKPEADR